MSEPDATTPTGTEYVDDERRTNVVSIFAAAVAAGRAVAMQRTSLVWVQDLSNNRDLGVL